MINKTTYRYVAALTTALRENGINVPTADLVWVGGDKGYYCYEFAIHAGGDFLQLRLLSSPNNAADHHWLFRNDESQLGGTGSVATVDQIVTAIAMELAFMANTAVMA